jgi:hypothetical protein
MPSKSQSARSVYAPRNAATWKHRIMVGIPTMGTVRIEWHNAMTGIIVPMNWSNSTSSPIGFHVDDAQNLIVNETLANGFEWMLLIEDDVVIPPDILIKLAPYLESKKYPIVSGLYNLKAFPPQPMIFRGRGNGAFGKFKLGDKVMADGVPTGCLLVHTSILKELANHVDTYQLRANGGVVSLKRVFRTPQFVFTDESLGSYQKLVGTSDLYFCDQIKEFDILRKAGWKRLANEEWPFLVDTSIRCGHIDRVTGQIY